MSLPCLHNPLRIKGYCHNGAIRRVFLSLTIGNSARLASIPRRDIPAERDRDAAIARVETIRGHVRLAVGDPLNARETIRGDTAEGEIRSEEHKSELQSLMRNS